MGLAILSSHEGGGLVLVVVAVATGFSAIACMTRRAWVRYGPAPNIPRRPGNDSLYAVVGYAGSPSLGEWPPPGTAGRIPRRGRVVALPELLGFVGAEVWLVELQGSGVCLLDRAATFDADAALSWAADCVEHLAEHIGGILLAGTTVGLGPEPQRAITACLAFARKHAAEHTYDVARAEELRRAVKHAKTHTIPRARLALGIRQVDEFSRPSPMRSLSAVLTRGGRRTRWNAQRKRRFARSTALSSANNAFLLVLDAARALCGEDPLKSARSATSLCRKAASYDQVSHAGADQAARAEAASNLNLADNPLARGRDLTSAPGKLTALMHGGDAEGIWQMRRLKDYLHLPAETSATPTAA